MSGKDRKRKRGGGSASGRNAPLPVSRDIAMLDSFHDPITYAPMTDPVLCAEDGHTYDRASIEAWIATCARNGRPPTSPLTRVVISAEGLKPNTVVKKLMEEFRRKVGGGDGVAIDALIKEHSEKSDQPIVSSVGELDAVFAALDPLRGTLSSMLDGWAPPQIVVVGNEDSGKSTLLERLAMMPIFPRGSMVCTRIAIAVQLRRGDAAPVVLEMVDVETGESVAGSRLEIAAEVADTHVREAMDAEIQRANGSTNGVCHDRRIVLHVTRPDLPNLDFLDLPGIVGASRRGEPKDMGEQTAQLARSNIKRIGDAGLFLWTHKDAEVHDSNALKLVKEDNPEFEARTIGVLTMSDKVHEDDVEKFCNQVLQRDHFTELSPNGFVATMLCKLKSTSSEGMSNIERLRCQAQREIKFFSENFSAVTAAERGGCNALVARLGALNTNYVKQSWAPQTLSKIKAKEESLGAEERALGLPRAHDVALLTDALRAEVCAAVAKKIVTALPGLMNAFARKQLVPLRARIRALMNNGQPEKIKLSEVAARTGALRDGVKAACMRSVAEVQTFLLADVLAPVKDDTLKNKCARFNTLVTALEEIVSTWLDGHAQGLRATVAQHADHYFENIPSNTTFSLDGDNDNWATIAHKPRELVGAVFTELVAHTSALCAMLAASLASGDERGGGGASGGLVDRLRAAVSVEACAPKRTALLADLEKLAHAKAKIVELTGMTVWDVALIPPFPRKAGVVIAGATGKNRAWINGTYRLSSKHRKPGGAPVYYRAHERGRDEFMWLYLNTNKRWCLSSKTEMQERSTKSYLNIPTTVVDGTLPHEMPAGKWKVWDGTARKVQPSVSVSPIE